MTNAKSEAAYYDPQDPFKYLREKAQTQPWFRKYSNTVTGGVGAAGSIIWLLITMGVEIPAAVANPVFSVLAVLTAVGLFNTPNGLPEQQVKQLEAEYRGRHRKGE